MARKTRSAADIARSRARSGRSSLKRSEPPRKNRKKARARKKDRESSPPRRARNRKGSSRRKTAKKRAPKTRSLSRERRRGGGPARLLGLVVLMMALGFGLVWGLDAWARLSRPAPRAQVEATPASEAPAPEEKVGLAQLWDKFVDRLLDRDLPVRNRKPVLPAARTSKPKPTPRPTPPPAPEPPDPSGRAETRAPPPSDYQARSRPLEQAEERRARSARTRKERLDKIFDQVGLD